MQMHVVCWYRYANACNKILVVSNKINFVILKLFYLWDNIAIICAIVEVYKYMDKQRIIYYTS